MQDRSDDENQYDPAELLLAYPQFQPYIALVGADAIAEAIDEHEDPDDALSAIKKLHASLKPPKASSGPRAKRGGSCSRGRLGSVTTDLELPPSAPRKRGLNQPKATDLVEDEQSDDELVSTVGNRSVSPQDVDSPGTQPSQAQHRKISPTKRRAAAESDSDPKPAKRMRSKREIIVTDDVDSKDEGKGTGPKKTKRNRPKAGHSNDADDDSDEGPKKRTREPKLRIPTYPRKAILYQPRDGEPVETHDTIVMGESPDLEDADEEDLPCRRLYNFSTYDDKTKRMVYVEDVSFNENIDPCFSGMVRPVYAEGESDDEFEDDVSDEESNDGDDAVAPMDIEEVQDPKGKGKEVIRDSKGKGKAVVAEDLEPNGTESPIETAGSAKPGGQWMKSSSIFHLEIHYTETGHGMWLKTQFGYYRLVKPAKEYEPFFEKISKAVRITWRILITLKRRKNTTYDEFLQCLNDVQKLPPPPNGGSSSSVGDMPNTMELEEEARYPLELTEQDMKDNIDWITTEVEGELEHYYNSTDDFTGIDLELTSSPLWKRISGFARSKGARGSVSANRERRSQLSKQPHAFQSNAVVSPGIRKLEGKLFGGNVNELPLSPSDEAPVKAVAAKRALARSSLENGVEPEVPADKKGKAKATIEEKENVVPLMDDDDGQPIDPAKLYDFPSIPPLPDVNNYKLKWLTSLGESNGRLYYSSVRINGEMDHVEVGHHVIARPEEESKAHRSSEGWVGVVKYLYQSKSGSDSTMFAHVRWFNPLKDTFVGELAAHAGKLEGSRELVLGDTCDDIPLATICGVANVYYLEPHTTPPQWATTRWDQGHEEDRYNFFYRYYSGSKDDDMRYTDARRHEMQAPPSQSHLNLCEEFEWCDCCNVRNLANRDKNECHLIKLDGTEKVVGVCAKGMPFLLHDFVYIDSGEKETPFRIARVESFIPTNKGFSRANFVVGTDNGTRDLRVDWDKDVSDRVRLKVRMFRRADDITDRKEARKRSRENESSETHPDEHAPRDMRHLYITDNVEIIEISRLSGVCWIAHRSLLGETEQALTSYKLEDVNNFWMSEKLLPGDKTEPYPRSAFSFSPRRLRIREEQKVQSSEYLSKRHKPMKAMDLFAGCGGLTCGLEMSGAIETLWAVECDVAAAMTFKKNFPHATVYNQDINVLLERVWKRDKLQDPDSKKLRSSDGEEMDDLPEPGEVEFLYGGPPCQGFSRMNRWKKVDDRKNALIPTFMSFVEFYNHPKFKGFLAENVADILRFKPGGVQVGVNKMEGGVDKGVVKFIVRAALDMDFEVGVVILQAAYHGVPQNRRRCFVQGYRRGDTVSLPDWPKPVHCMETVSTSRASGGSTKVSSMYGGAPLSFNYYDAFAGAPHRALTIRETCSDLPGFEYTNPYKVMAQSDEDKKYDQSRKKWYPSYSEADMKVSSMGGEMEQRYQKNPLTLYQSKIRNGATVLHNHVVKQYKSIVIERICRVGMYPGADHLSLPKELAGESLWCLQGEGSAKDKHNNWKGLYGRLDYDKTFKTITTDMNPVNVQGTVLHPTQRRVMSVRENARGQGFPDTFIFCATNLFRTCNLSLKEMYRQVGNAVPVPLAEALGSKMRDAMSEGWARSSGELEQGEMRWCVGSGIAEGTSNSDEREHVEEPLDDDMEE
ncbi:hypothetical protein M427DRAFT_54236 [Gonapodya prolifera JEL478]|uniref:DNA (cytosine-5)-methyltransferase n=1 Tax=Gonapodya prolifera (strain JEL478) TaxID=1344416 RepID=A0A139ANE4_GONPJ|nr:hypothetical protein M427DRAFT_54236 [Gonapodya prolifera JEL478]|eukprot:KXS18025.1 hypothetical protein M427DRAFT_54236 [Gonapodya prolifera JEL478]